MLEVVCHPGTRYCLFITIYVFVSLLICPSGPFHGQGNISLFSTARVTVPSSSAVSLSKEFCACSPMETTYLDQKILGILGLGSSQMTMLENSVIAEDKDQLKLKISGFVRDTHMQLKGYIYLTDTYIFIHEEMFCKICHTDLLLWLHWFLSQYNNTFIRSSSQVLEHL